MIIEYDDDIRTQTFREHRDVLSRFDVNPEGEYGTIAQISDPSAALDRRALSRHPNGGLVLELFGHPEVPNVSLYGGVSNQWLRLDGTWPATIDTITHLRGQRESASLEGAESVLDIACGNGMAGVYSAKKNPKINYVMFSDIEPNAVLTTASNINSDNRNFQFRISDGFGEIKERFDVIIASAVPATPGYPGLKRPLNPLFEGTGLLEKLLRDAPSHLNPGGKLILSHSSAGGQDFLEFSQRYGANVDSVLYERDNAYRTEFLDDQAWVDFLVDNNGIEHRPNSQVPYWHGVSVKEISYE